MSPLNILPSPSAPPAAADRLRSARVLLVGLGNIGSYLSVLLAPSVGFVRLVDRGTVEPHNTMNQLFGPEHIGRNKADVVAERIARLTPHTQTECRVADLEDLPWGDLADVDVALGGLDSLWARQVLSERLFSLETPYIDGAVGEPLLVRVQVQIPGCACLQCAWGDAHYRQLTTEYPCRPGAAAEAPHTAAFGCAGSATASLMVAQCLKLFGPEPPQESYEMNGDLNCGRLVTALRRRNPRCRFDHAARPRTLRLQKSLLEATAGDLADTVQREFAGRDVHLEFRRGVLPGDMFGAERFTAPGRLSRFADKRLSQLGLTPADRVVVRVGGVAQPTHVLFDRAT